MEKEKEVKVIQMDNKGNLTKKESPKKDYTALVVKHTKSF